MQTFKMISQQANPEESTEVTIKDCESCSQRASVTLRFLICQVGIITATTLERYRKD